MFHLQFTLYYLYPLFWVSSKEKFYSSSQVHCRVLPLKIKLKENDIKLGNLCIIHLHALLVAVDSCMSQWILPQPSQHWPAASIARVSCFSLFSRVTYLHFAYAIRGRPFDSERAGWYFVEMNILTLKMLKIICPLVEKINTFLQLGGGGAKCPQNFRLASLATVKFSNNFSGSLRSQF